MQWFQGGQLNCCLMHRESGDTICIHNPTDGSVKVPANTFLGQGGNGEFKDLEAEPSLNRPGLWLFNRLCDFKRDVKDAGSGGVVFIAGGKDGTVGTPDDIQIQTVDNVAATINHDNQFTIYAHKIVKSSNRTSLTPASNPIVWMPESPGPDGVFSHTFLGQWLVPKVGVQPQAVRRNTIPLFEGCVRSAFAMGLEQFSLEPITTNPLCIFLNKQVEVDAKSFFVLD